MIVASKYGEPLDSYRYTAPPSIWASLPIKVHLESSGVPDCPKITAPPCSSDELSSNTQLYTVDEEVCKDNAPPCFAELFLNSQFIISTSS